VLHWRAFQRQGLVPCIVPLVLHARLHNCPVKIAHFVLGWPLHHSKRNNKTQLWAPIQPTLSEMRNQHFCFQTSLLGMSLGMSRRMLLGRLLGCQSQQRVQCLPSAQREDALQQHETQQVILRSISPPQISCTKMFDWYSITPLAGVETKFQFGDFVSCVKGALAVRSLFLATL